MHFPEYVHEMVAKACKEHPADISAACLKVERDLRNDDNFDSLVDSLIAEAVQAMVYNRRHAENVAIKKETGAYGGGTKTNVAGSTTINRICKSVYYYNIGAKTLGLLFGEELLGLADTEESIAAGHQFNASLLRELRKMVKDGQRVQDAVKEKKLRELFCKLGRKFDEAA